MVSIVCRATITPQKVHTRTDRKFRVNRLLINGARTKTTSSQNKVMFAIFNSSFTVGRMVFSFIIYVNAWEQTGTFLLLCKKQYCPCFQICYGNSLLFKAKLITCSCSKFLCTSRSLSSWVWSHSLIFFVVLRRQTITTKGFAAKLSQ